MRNSAPYVARIRSRTSGSAPCAWAGRDLSRSCRSRSWAVEVGTGRPSADRLGVSSRTFVCTARWHPLRGPCYTPREPEFSPATAVESPYLHYLNTKYRFPRSLVHGPIRRFLRSYLETAPTGARVLDAGCGNGVETGPLAGGLKVVGVDCQPSYVAHCARSYPAASWVRGDLTRLAFRDAAFDVIVLNQVVEHLPEPPATVAELARVLAPGGRLLVATPNYGAPGWPLVEKTYHRWFAREFDAEECHVTRFRSATLRQLLAPALRVEHIGTVCAALILVATARKA